MKPPAVNGNTQEFATSPEKKKLTLLCDKIRCFQ